MILEALGQSPLNSGVTAGMSKFMSLFRDKPSKAFGEDPNRYPRPYTVSRGIIINKEFVVGTKTPDLLKGYHFQFNPQQVHDSKTTNYETRSYTGLPYNDYIWSGGGERVITFQLFMDNTPQSKQRSFRPTAYGSKLAKEFKTEGMNFAYDENGRNTTDGKSKRNLMPSPGPTHFEYVDNGAYSTSRVDERGILPEVELLQSFLYPAPLAGEDTPRFAEGGIVSSNQFRPPATAILALGQFYFEGVIKSAPVTYTLFDYDLTPIRGTADIEFAVFEFENIERMIRK